MEGRGRMENGRVWKGTAGVEVRGREWKAFSLLWHIY